MDIRTFRPVDHEKEFTGVLKDFDKNRLVIELRGP